MTRPLIAQQDLHTTRAEPDINVTRTEIANLIGDVFAEPAVSKEKLLAHARHHQGRTPVLSVLEGLQERTYYSLRDLWGQLQEVPVGD